MGEGAYMVVLESGVSRESAVEVGANLARLFGISENRCRRLLNGKPVILKNGLTLAAAQAYQNRIEMAGAPCSVKPMDAKAAPAGKAGDGDAHPPHDHPRPTPLKLVRESESLFYAPIAVPHLSPHPVGIDLNRRDTVGIAYHNIEAISVFAEKIGNHALCRVLIFIRGLQRPYLVDATNIRFQEFEAFSAVSTKDSLREFVEHLRRRHPALQMDEHTAGFLAGRLIHELDTGMREHATAVGKALSRETADAKTHGNTVETAPRPPAAATPQTMTAPPVSPSPGIAPAAEATAAETKSDELPEPQIEFKPFTWTDVAVTNIVAFIQVLFIVGIWKAPVTFYGFFMSHIKINGTALRFTDGYIWLRTFPCLAPFVGVMLYGTLTDPRGIWGAVVVWLALLSFVLSTVSAAAVFFRSFLVGTYGPGGETPFEAPFEEGNLPSMLEYIKSNPKELATLFAAFALINTILLCPFGFFLFAKTVMNRLRVQGHSYTFSFPWVLTLKWCVLGYLSCFLGYLKYIELLYTEIMPSGRWVKVRKYRN